MLTHLICATWLALAQTPEAPAADTPAPAAQPAPVDQAAPVAAPESPAVTGDNPPPALYDPVAEEAGVQRDRLIKRVITWSGAAVGGVGLAVAMVGLAAAAGAVASWLYVNRLEDAGKSTSAITPFKLLGNGLLGVGGVFALLAAPFAALGSAWFVTSYLSGDN